MGDQDFVISFRAEVQNAINQMKLLVEMAVAAETAINRVQAAGSRPATGANTATRAQQQTAATFQNLGIGAKDLEKRLAKLGPEFAASFEAAIRRLPRTLGDIKLAKIANQAPPIPKFADAIRSFKALEVVFDSNQRKAAGFRKEAEKLITEVTKLADPRIQSLLDQAKRAGSRGDTRLEINSLRGAQTELRNLQKIGANVTARLDTVRQRLVDLGQTKGINQTRAAIEGLLPRIRTLRETAEARGLLGNQTGQLATLRNLEELLTRLQVRGANVAKTLAGVKGQIATTSASLSAQATTGKADAAFKKLQGNVLSARTGVAVANDLGGSSRQISALNKLADALVRIKLAGVDTRAELARVRRDIASLSSAAANTKAIDKLLRARTANERNINSRANAGLGESRRLRETGEDINLALAARGHAGAAQAAALHAAALAKLGPAISAEVAALLRERDALLQTIAIRERVGLKPTGPQLGRGLAINQQLSQVATGPTAANAAADMQRFSTAIDANRGKLATWDSAFGHHARRIAEGLIIYNAFGAALGGVADSFKVVANLDTEMARFEAVVGDLTDTQVGDFIAGIGEVAVNTATDMHSLLASADQLAATFRHITDPVERAAAVTGFADIAGQFSNVTGQTDQDAVTSQLVALFRQTRDETLGTNEQLDQFRLFLDLIVTAGGNASSVITQVAEGMREVAPSAKAAGADLGVLAFAMAEVIQETGESGLTIGNVLRNILAKTSVGSTVSDAFDGISESVVKLTDEAGRLLPATTIIENLFNAVDAGQINRGDAQEIFRQLGPEINPGQLGLINAIFDAVGEGIKRTKAEAGDAGGALQQLSDIIVNTLGKRFDSVIQRFNVLLTTKLVGPITAVGSILIGVLEGVANVLENDFARAAITTVVTIGLITGGLGLLITAGKRIALAFLGVKTFVGALGSPVATAAVAMKGLGTATDTAAIAGKGLLIYGPAGQVISTAGAAAGTAGTKIGFMGSVINGAVFALKRFLPLLVAMAAVDFVDSIAGAHALGDAINDITGKDNVDPLQEVSFEGQKKPLKELLEFAQLGPISDIFDSKETQNQARNIKALSDKFKELADANNLTREKADALTRVFVDQDGAIKTTIVTADEMDAAMLSLQTSTADTADAGAIDWWSDYSGGMLDTGEAIDEMTAAEIRAADALRENVALSPLRGQLIADLTAQLDAGTISLDEFTSGLGDIDSASEAAASFVTLLGDHLDLIPGLVERISQSGESPAEALTRLLTANPETSGQQIELINRMIEIVEAHEEVRDTIAANPITVKPKVDNTELKKGTELFFDILGIMHAKNISPIVKPKMDLGPFTAQAQKFLKLLTFLGIASSSVGGKNFGSKSKSGGSDLSGLLGELSAIGSAIGEVGTIGPDDPRLDSAKEPPKPEQSALLDLGDLSPALVPQIIALAAAAQKRIIAAGGVADTEDTTAILKDGVFQKLVKGIDNRLLTEAMQQLTEVEKKRLELEQQRLQDVTRSIVTQVGPIQSLTSAPVLAAGGGLLAGQGFNADPRLGNVTISVPINWSGMSLTQLQKFIYESISKAWIDAGKGA